MIWAIHWNQCRIFMKQRNKKRNLNLECHQRYCWRYNRLWFEITKYRWHVIEIEINTNSTVQTTTMNYITSVGYYIDKENGVCWSKGYLKRNLNSSMGHFFNERWNEKQKMSLYNVIHTTGLAIQSNLNEKNAHTHTLCTSTFDWHSHE